ncbi:MAG: OsmC family protein [Bacteroidetes bacterium]|nr:OsmC family protein [Bacteroidota bacterium]
MSTSVVTYSGNLRTTCTHLSSGKTIITDAPIDNHGKGEAFSPTDLVATSLASCMLTIIGIYCQNHDIEFISGTVEVEKIMASSPRKIEKIRLNIDLNANNWDQETRKKVIAAGKACPVAKTLDGNVVMEFNFK